MSVTPAVNSASKSQALSRQIASEVDANKDGQISTNEFGTFILNVLEGKSSITSGTSAFRTAIVGSAGTAGAASGPNNIWAASRLGYDPAFLGFDSSRIGAPSIAGSAAGSLKYDAYNVLKNYDPRDPNAMKSAFAELSALHPGSYELDAQDNLMLTGTADGYIGARPLNRDSDWNNRNQDFAWQWHGYNPAHPGPNGEIT